MSDIQNLKHQIEALKLQLADEKQASLHYQQQAVNIEAAAKQIVKDAYATQSRLNTELVEAKNRINTLTGENFDLAEKLRSRRPRKGKS